MKKLITLATMVGLVLGVAVPAAAHGLGPAFYCDAGTLNNCTDTTDPTSAEDTFACEGEVGDAVSCTDRPTGESSPYCAFMGDETGKNRDAYLCGSPADFSDQLVDRFWQQVEAAQAP